MIWPRHGLALLFLSLQRDLTGQRRTPRALILLAGTGTVVACFFAGLTALKVWNRLMG